MEEVMNKIIITGVSAIALLAGCSTDRERADERPLEVSPTVTEAPPTTAPPHTAPPTETVAPRGDLERATERLVDYCWTDCSRAYELDPLYEGEYSPQDFQLVTMVLAAYADYEIDTLCAEFWVVDDSDMLDDLVFGGATVAQGYATLELLWLVCDS
jgi:hypothetical protein